jgi:hypothetical protein
VADRFAHHIIEGAVDLDSIAYSHKLVIQDCVFRGTFYAREGRFARTVDLSGCTFEQGVTFQGAHIEGELIVNRATIRKAGEGCSADFEQVHIGRNFTANKITVEGAKLSDWG